MVVEPKPREQQKPREPQRHSAPPAPRKQTDAKPPTGHRQRPQYWQQRRQELLRRERALAAVFGAISLVGTLAMLYVAAQANAADESYRRSGLDQQIQDMDAKNLLLQSEIRGLENGNAIGQLAAQRNLVRSPEGIHYFGEKL